MGCAVEDVSGEHHCCTQKLWRHLRLQEHPTNFAADRVDQLLRTSILKLPMLVGVQLFLHVVLFDHFTWLLRMLFRCAVGFDDGVLVIIWCLKTHTIGDLGNLIFRCMHCGISTIVNKH